MLAHKREKVYSEKNNVKYNKYFGRKCDAGRKNFQLYEALHGMGG